MLYEEFLKELGFRLKMRRMQLGMTQARLGELVDISEHRISEIESGRCNITLKSLHKTTENENYRIQNKTSGLKWLPNTLGGEYFNSEWSFAQVRITDSRSICCFEHENTIIIVSTEGKYYKAQIDLEKGGDCKIIEERKLIE